MTNCLTGILPEYPHVTAVLRDSGLIDAQWFEQFDLDRGTAVHAATHYLDEGTLSWDSCDPIILGRLRSYQRFLDEVRPEILSIEEPVVNRTFRYQGRLDRRVRINGREGVLDLKGQSRAAWHGAQLAAYAHCFLRPLARWNLYLSDDCYRLVEQTTRGDWNVFLAALTITNWRIENGH